MMLLISLLVGICILGHIIMKMEDRKTKKHIARVNKDIQEIVIKWKTQPEGILRCYLSTWNQRFNIKLDRALEKYWIFRVK